MAWPVSARQEGCQFWFTTVVDGRIGVEHTYMAKKSVVLFGERRTE